SGDYHASAHCQGPTRLEKLDGWW
ncbi:hypothetical protein A5874_000646, partial [Enterococcus faecium]